MKNICLLCLFLVLAMAVAFGNTVNNTGPPGVALVQSNLTVQNCSKMNAEQTRNVACLPTTTINRNIVLMPATIIEKNIFSEQAIFRHPVKCEVVTLKCPIVNFAEHIEFRSSPSGKGKVILKYPILTEVVDIRAKYNNAT
ncbi:MAG: hypothetical protein WC575_04045 [Patescibacteria group bacterium]